MKVTIKPKNFGAEEIIEVEPTSTILEVKKKWAECHDKSFEISGIKFIWGGHILENHQSLIDYRIKDGATILSRYSDKKVAKDPVQLEEAVWYYPKMTKEEAEEALKRSNRNTFLVRNSQILARDDEPLLTLSFYNFREKTILHQVFGRNNWGEYVFHDNQSFTSQTALSLMDLWQKRNPQFFHLDMEDTPTYESDGETDEIIPEESDIDIGSVQSLSKEIQEKNEQLELTNSQTEQREKQLKRVQEVSTNELKKIELHLEDLKKKKEILEKEIIEKTYKLRNHENSRNLRFGSRDQLSKLEREKEEIAKEMADVLKQKENLKEEIIKSEELRCSSYADYLHWREKQREEMAQLEEMKKKLMKLEQTNRKIIRRKKREIFREMHRLADTKLDLEKKKQDIEKREMELKLAKVLLVTNVSVKKAMELGEKEKELRAMKLDYQLKTKQLEEKQRELEEAHEQLIHKEKLCNVLNDEVKKFKKYQEDYEECLSKIMQLKKLIQNLKEDKRDFKKKSAKIMKRIKQTSKTISTLRKTGSVAPASILYFGKKEDELDQFERNRRHCFIETLKIVRDSFSENTEEKKTCFISYAWGEDKYAREVERLVSYLQAAGFEMVFDKMNRDPTSKFIERLRTVDLILVVGTHKLLEKYNWKTSDPSENQPVVKSEMDIVDQIVKKNELQSRKVKPILFEGTASESLPPSIEHHVHVDFVRQDYYESVFQLIENLYDIDYNHPKMKKIKQDFEDKTNQVHTINQERDKTCALM